MNRDQITNDDSLPHPSSRRRLRSTLVAAGAALGMTLGGLGVAQAQTDDEPDALSRPPGANEAPALERPFRHHSGDPHLAPAIGMGIRGESVTRKPGGGYQTVAHQLGTVTAVSSTSITVRSEDGFSRTYTVNDDTLVTAGDAGIADVKGDDTVRVIAVVEDGGARAVAVHDVSRARELRQKWLPAPTPRGGTGA